MVRPRLASPGAVSQNGALHRNTLRPVTIAGNFGEDVAGLADGGAKLPTINHRSRVTADGNKSDGVMASRLCASKVHHVRKLGRL
jgi:hypothetical protein